MIVLRTRLPRILATGWALAAVTAFAVECKTLLHTNLHTVTVDFAEHGRKHLIARFAHLRPLA